jgi:hypothetical protein
MVDREQTRRDANEKPAVLLIRQALESAMCGAESRELAIAHFDALLAELEQAERERDKWRERSIGRRGLMETEVFAIRDELGLGAGLSESSGWALVDHAEALQTSLGQAERDLEGVHLALAEANIPRADGVDEPLYSEQHRVRLLRERAEQAERARDSAEKDLAAMGRELAQAERERDEARTEASGFYGGEIKRLNAELAVERGAEARLAKVPALVEAARRHRCVRMLDHPGGFGTCPHCEALAAWEQK